MARGFAHPGVHEIGDETQRRNGTADPGVTVLDSGSHINDQAQRRGREADTFMSSILALSPTKPSRVSSDTLPENLRRKFASL
jgi:hypothetical protein